MIDYLPLVIVFVLIALYGYFLHRLMEWERKRGKRLTWKELFQLMRK